MTTSKLPSADQSTKVSGRCIKPEKFWARMVKPNGEDGCWEFPSRDYRGYGMASYNGKSIGAHRLAFFFHHGRMPELFVLHSCDNPPCCNPSHLREGTNQENMRDAVERQRTARGVNMPSSRLDDERVLEIRRLFASGVPIRTLARQFGVAQNTARNVIRRVTWAHVKDDFEYDEKPRVSKLNDVAVFVIRYCVSQGMSHSRVARAYRIPIRTISAVAAGQTWKNIKFPEAFRSLQEKS